MTQLMTPPNASTRAAAPATAPAPAVRAMDLVKTYGRGATAVRALDGASVDLDRGAFAAIMGPSGSGKSTLMHALAGLDSVDSGRVVMTAGPGTGEGEVDVTALTERQRTLLRRGRGGVVFLALNLRASPTRPQHITPPLPLRRP